MPATAENKEYSIDSWQCVWNGEDFGRATEIHMHDIETPLLEETLYRNTDPTYSRERTKL